MGSSGSRDTGYLPPGGGGLGPASDGAIRGFLTKGDWVAKNDD